MVNKKIILVFLVLIMNAILSYAGDLPGGEGNLPPGSFCDNSGRPETSCNTCRYTCMGSFQFPDCDDVTCCSTSSNPPLCCNNPSPPRCNCRSGGYAWGYCDTQCPDSDSDGYTATRCGGRDCDDSNSMINPGASEQCNGVDDDCDNLIDEGFPTQTYYLDRDLDNWGGYFPTLIRCYLPSGYSINTGDCDDDNQEIHPAPPGELLCADNLDNDCDNSLDCSDSDCFYDSECCIPQTYYRDFDNDGWGNATIINSFCESTAGWTLNDDDCNDNNQWIHPAPPNEIGSNCNDNLDNDCDTYIDCDDIGCTAYPGCAAKIRKPIPDQTVAEDSETFFYINITNPWRHVGITLSYSSNPPVTENVSIWKLINNDVWAFSWIPELTRGGRTNRSYNFTFTLNDNGNIDVQNNTITVLNVNRAPIITEPISNYNEEESQAGTGIPNSPEGRIVDLWVLKTNTLWFNVTAIDPDVDYDVGFLSVSNASWRPEIPVHNFSVRRIGIDRWSFNWTAPYVTEDTTFNTTIIVNDTFNANDTINLIIHVQFGTVKIPMQCGNVTINNAYGFYPACYQQPDSSAQCTGLTDCVYNNKTTDPICYPKRTKLNDTTLPPEARKEITCSQNNTWCPSKMKYNDIIKYCVWDHELCDVGYFPTPIPVYHCWNITTMLNMINIPICFLENPPIIPYYRSCCKYFNWTNTENGTYYLGEPNNIIVI
ncbi:MAG: putative metal-binding motif-containing protein [Candidatus Woesearchaeota archaeon]